MKEFNMTDYYRLPSRTFESQTGMNEVWRSVMATKKKNCLTIIFGDDVVFEMGWKAGDRLCLHQHKKDPKSFFLMDDTIGIKLCKNVGTNTRTCRIIKMIDLPIMKLAPCQSWKKVEVEIDGVQKKILTITL